MCRCINIDWLSCFCYEPAGSPRDAFYYREQGYEVVERSYGTPTCAQMFTVYEQGIACFEVRRAPYSLRSNGGVFEDGACFIRLVNRLCYIDEPVNYLRSVIIRHGYTYRSISRIDICLDFTKFDYGDAPQKFIRRYVEHKYSKINQCKRHMYGEDRWAGSVENSISWGSPSSMVRTRFYNKTLQLKEVGDKPYIRQAWHKCGLVASELDTDTTVWRVEFSINSTATDWFAVENGKKIERWPHDFSRYDSRDKLLVVFMSLAQHYFHFKILEHLPDGSLQRKDRCKDKLLFSLARGSATYRIGRVTTNPAPDRFVSLIIRRLEKLADSPDVSRDDANILFQAINVLRKEQTRSSNVDWNEFLNRVHDVISSVAYVDKGLELYLFRNGSLPNLRYHDKD